MEVEILAVMRRKTAFKKAAEGGETLNTRHPEAARWLAKVGAHDGIKGPASGGGLRAGGGG